MSAMVLDLKAAWQKILACQMVGLTCWTEALALHNCLQQLGRQASPAPEANVRSSCIKLLTETLHKVDPTWVVKPFGSSANGFSSKELGGYVAWELESEIHRAA
eukprot:g19611.t1